MTKGYTIVDSLKLIPGTGGEEGEPILATIIMVPTHFIPSLKKWFEAEFSVDVETSREGGDR